MKNFICRSGIFENREKIFYKISIRLGFLLKNINIVLKRGQGKLI
jgi:hypothetical protein